MSGATMSHRSGFGSLSDVDCSVLSSLDTLSETGDERLSFEPLMRSSAPLKSWASCSACGQARTMSDSLR